MKVSSFLFWFATTFITNVSSQTHFSSGFVGDIPDNVRNGEDLSTFISRPDLRPPVFDVKIYQDAHITPGYWFVAPYAILPSEPTIRKYTPAQVGPHIYDYHGNLIWSGADLFDQRGVFDFKVTTFQGSPHLTFILDKAPLSSISSIDFPLGASIIMSNSYEIIAQVQTKPPKPINMHEFNVVHPGKTALIITHRTQTFHESSQGPDERIVLENGFQEVDLLTGNVVFEWQSLDHIPLSASLTKPQRHAWDYFHLNSVDKDLHGDYLISSRDTSCIYKVSGVDGSIIWQLGGRNSSFVLQNFNFSSQHDARIHYENKTTTIISFLNNASAYLSNASDIITSAATESSALLIALDTSASPMIATLLKRWPRPDGQLTEIRGNVQVLPNRNVFVGWSSNGYISEFTDNGNCVFEARFTSPRFTNYRAYKFNFTASPRELPALKAYAFGTSPATTTTVFYTSWNGATEVALWRFYGSPQMSGTFTLIGTASKAGFETTYMAAGYVKWVFSEGISADGRSLGNSSLTQTIIPPGWDIDSSGGIFLNNEAAEKSNDNGRYGIPTTLSMKKLIRVRRYLMPLLTVLLFLVSLAFLVFCFKHRLPFRRFKYQLL